MEFYLQGLKSQIRNKDDRGATMIAPLTLAYMGDAVFETYIRQYLIENNKLLLKDFHNRAVSYVKAEAQAEIVGQLKESLTQEEWSIIKKGRNQKTTRVPKNVKVADYKHATGFETLLGYLFFNNSFERLMEIMDMSVKIINNKEKGA